MITTIDIKQKLRDVFEIGNGSTNILVLGSCRCVPYINYLDRYNRTNGEPFKLFAIEPNNYHWNEHEQEVSLDEELTKLETSERILGIIQEADIFIHEHYSHFQIFNTAKDAPKNIYQFGMFANMDIAIPNFHDHFILENDYAACGLSAPDNYIEHGEAEIEKFCAVCRLSSFPEMADYFRDNWRSIRFFYRPNHVSAVFTMYIFRRMNSRFLNLTLSEEFWNGAKQEDLFRDPHTGVTERDIKGYRLQWR
jgi:hypothetical protein